MAVLKRELGSRTTLAARCPALEGERASVNAASGMSFYELSGAALTASDIGIAILDPAIVPIVTPGSARATAQHAGHTEVFSVCTTSEGVRFSVREDEAPGRELWSGAYYLGVDLEPNCPD